MTSEVFWPAFWPNFVSTILGVLFGVPFALYLNRQAVARVARSRKEDERELLTHGLGAVKSALEHNGARLRALDKALAEGSTLFELDLDVFAWEAVRDQIVPLLKSADLQRHLALHFCRLSELARLWGRYADMTTGVGSVVSGVEQTQVALRRHMRGRVEVLNQDARQVIASINTALRGAS